MMTLAEARQELPVSLRRVSNEIRRRDLRMVYEARSGHIGGDFSAIDILTTLYFAVLRIDPEQPGDPGRDRFILSKGHCAGALYTVLAYRGFLPMRELQTFMRPNSRLNGHPDRTKVPGVETNTGPLGHGLPVGVGAALGARIAGAAWRTFVLAGDGELQEGSNWEAAMTGAHRKLDNLTVFVDRNGLQQGDTTERTVSLDPLVDRWRAFGWAVGEVDGHDHAALFDLTDRLPLERGRPTCIIAHTVKGKGVSFMENRVEWHHKVPNAEQVEAALLELESVGPSAGEGDETEPPVAALVDGLAAFRSLKGWTAR